MKEEMDDINAREWFAKYRHFTPKAMEIIKELSDEMVRMSTQRLPVVFGWYTLKREGSQWGFGPTCIKIP